jgi:hypothetical protein
MRQAVSNMHAFQLGARKTRKLSFALICVGLAILFSFRPMGAKAQEPVTQLPLSPPINHESGRVEEVITAVDDGARQQAYVLIWRSMRVVVAGTPDEAYRAGDDLDVLVYRTEANGHKVLRFAANPSASDENVVDRDSAESGASMTLGTARIEETVSAESDGYRFLGYFVTWHDKRVFVVDPQSAPIRAVGETINFRVWRTRVGAAQRLSFSL